MLLSLETMAFKIPVYAAVFFLAGMTIGKAGLTNRYVLKNNAAAAEPYDSHANAAGDIQTAINYAYAGETVLVAAATYDTGGVTNYPVGTLITNRIAIYKAITVRSANNDPANTIIKGAWDPVLTNGNAAVRCVFMTNGASLIGFTLTNGATLAAIGASNNNHHGGGVISLSSATTFISNCVIVGNRAALLGGGVFQGALHNCRIAGNAVRTGVGAINDGSGGGAYVSLLYDCLLEGNIGSMGAAASMSTLYNCTLTANSGTHGIYTCNMYNCLIVSNACTSAVRGGHLV